MRATLGLTALSAWSLFATATPAPPGVFWKRQAYGLAPVSSSLLQDSITSAALLERSQALEDIAYATPNRNRLMGSQGHNDTVTYIYEQLTALGDCYTVELQPWSALVSEGGNASFSANGTVYAANLMDYSANGSATGSIVPVNNLGCNTSDYPASVAGNIALIPRGSCEFGLKSALAGAAGAVGALIYNNIAGPLSGTLGVPPRPEGPYVPTGGLSQSDGLQLASTVGSGSPLLGVLDITSIVYNASTYNVIAQTKGGNPNSTLMLGAHSDSVAAGPGINDDGSGSVGILEVAVQLANYSTTNSVRFGWWSGEEEGLLGSTYYVEHLSAEELAKIRLYLNFDMIASPNYVYAIYDGDGNAFNLSGPPGSAEAEHFFEDFYDRNGLNRTSTAFDGRSDYGPFLDAGIASGGLFTGAEENKTEEEAAMFGGTAGIALDPNYHGPGDNVTNLDMDAFLVNTKAIADAVATFGQSFASLNQTALTRRQVKRSLPSVSLRRSASSIPWAKRPVAKWSLARRAQAPRRITAQGKEAAKLRRRPTRL